MEQLVSGFGDNWRSYFVIFDQPLHICYDATVKQLPQHIRKKFPNTVIIKIPFMKGNESYYPPGKETDWIFDISENLHSGRFDARMVGIVISPNWGYIVLCCNIKEKRALKLINTLFKGFDFPALSYDFRSDDNFAYYDTVLAAAYYEENCIKNRAVCERLAQRGEAFQKPREIHFLCCFSDPEHIQQIVDQFADHFAEYGFHETDRKKAENAEYWLQFDLKAIPSLDWIHEITCWIIHSLEGTKGYFDGWDCLAIKEDDA